MLFRYEELLYLQERVAAEGKGMLRFDQELGPGYFAAVDGEGNLQEVGWVKIPSLQTLSWAAQWLEYRKGLQKQLSGDAFVVPIFESEVHSQLREVIASSNLLHSQCLLAVRGDNDTMILKNAPIVVFSPEKSNSTNRDGSIAEHKSLTSTSRVRRYLRDTVPAGHARGAWHLQNGENTPQGRPGPISKASTGL